MQTLLQLALINALCATVVALFAFGASLLCRRPALVHWLWIFVFVRLLMPPLVPVSLPPTAGQETVSTLPTSVPDTAPDPSQEEEDRATVVPVLDEAFGEVSPSGLIFMAAAWALGSATIVLWTAYRFWQLRSLFRLAHPASRELREQVQALAGRMGLRRVPPVWLMPNRLSPLVILKSGRPVILLPQAFWNTLSEDGQRTILAHELAHIRRGDPWVRLLELIGLAIFWWHPVVWWAGRKMRAVEDECCDAWVVWAQPGCEDIYARTLLETTAFLSGCKASLPLLATQMGRVSRFKRRLRMVLEGNTSRGVGRTGAVIVACLAGLLLLSPAWGHGGGALLLEDSFAEDGLDTERWEILRAPVRQKGGHLALLNRSYVATKAEYPEPISLSLRWRWIERGQDPLYKDLFAIALRTSGRPKPVHSYEVRDGIAVKFDATGGMISIDAMPKVQVLTRSKDDVLHIPPGVWHDIRITDDGDEIAVYLRIFQAHEQKRRWHTLKAHRPAPSPHHRIALYNREFVGGTVHESHVRDFVLRPLPKRSRGK